MKIGFEVLKQGDLFLKFLRIVSEQILGKDVLLFSRRDRFAFIVVEACASVFSDYFGRIIEENSC